MLRLLPLFACAVMGAQNPLAEADELWREGRRAESLARLETALEQRPEDLFTRRLLVEREMAVHRYARALEHMAPLGFDARRHEARAHYMLGHYEQAVELFDTTDEGELLMLVRTLLRLGRIEESDRWLDRARKLLDEDPRVHVLEGRRLARLGRHADAVPVFAAVLASDPYDAEALFGHGQALVRSGQREAGLATLARHRALAPLLDQLDFAERGVDLAPNHAPNHAQVGDVQRRIGRTDAAEAAYVQGLALATPEQVPPIALRLARLLHEDADDLAGALRVLEAAVRRAPDARLLVRAGDLLADAGRYAEALEQFRAAQRTRPGDEEITARLAACRAKLDGDGR